VELSSIKGRYAKIEIPLNKAETEKELHLTGDYLTVISITGSGTCKIKLDHRHSQELDLREISDISGSFERVYLTTDGGGGICSVFLGTGMAVHVNSNPQKLYNGWLVSAQATTPTDAVYAFADVTFILKNVNIINMNGKYSAYVGPYVNDVATFKAHAYLLLPHRELRFGTADMYALACVSYSVSHVVKLGVVGTYE
jgi:hypothetical protein